jgi:hypothetical protein
VPGRFGLSAIFRFGLSAIYPVCNWSAVRKKKISAQSSCVKDHRIFLEHGEGSAFSRRQEGSGLGARAAAVVRDADRQAAPAGWQAPAWQEARPQAEGAAGWFAAQEAARATRAASGARCVINNWRKHREDRREATRTWKIDWFSTAITFPGWAEYGDQPFLWRGPATYDPLVVYQPRTWLLREGYKRGGPPISVREVPSAPRQRPVDKPC